MSRPLDVAPVLLVAAGTAYHRQLYRRLTRWVAGPTTTAAWEPVPGEPALHLAVAGDVGHPGPRLAAVGDALAGIDAVRPFDGLLLLGDQAYPSGDPALLEDTVFGPFASLLDHADLYAVLGNHDVRGPGPWARSRVPPAHRNHPAAQMRALGMPGRWWARHLPGDVLLVGLDSTLADHADQHAWLEHTLASATERWRIVAVHHPPYSAGYQGSSLDVRGRWSPVFARYGVQLVLSGHDHDYQRSVPVDGVTYVVSGGASSSRRTGRAGFTAAALGWRHALELAVFPDRLVVRAVGPGGRVGDEAALEVVTSGPRTGR